MQCTVLLKSMLLLSAPPPPNYSLVNRYYAHLRERGMTLIEVILIALFLAGTAIGATYFFAQTKVTMSSSSQVTQCNTIAKQALENVVSLGTRLYGYKINHNEDSQLSYDPLFIKKNGSAVDDVGDGSQLSFPPEMYKTLYENLGVTPIIEDPKTNTGHPLIGATYPYDLSTSSLIVNSVNALQYLYNTDSAFFTANSGKGKKYTSGSMSGDIISKMIKKYEKQFDLDNMTFFIKVSPIDLTTEEYLASPSSQILTRPQFRNPQGGTLSPSLNVLGNENIGFGIKVTLEYTDEGQDYNCDATHRFSHQGKLITKRVRSLSVSLIGLVSGAGTDLTASDTKKTSCDTDGTGYEDITVTVDFGSMGEGQQFGTVILCQMNSYCRSYGDGTYSGCSPELGRWQRCHDIIPNPSSDQNWTYSSSLTNNSSQELKMTFSDMKIDRRYELNIGEFSMAGHQLRFHHVAKFYIDAKRPSIGGQRVINNIVGHPLDGGAGRNYSGPPTSWSNPGSSSRWLQCVTGTVEFAASLDDQFTHNLENCIMTGNKQDGNGTSPTSPTATSDCGGHVNVASHGRYTITFNGSDTCGDAQQTQDLVWDADLPSSYEVKDFTDNIQPFKSIEGDAFPIETIIPAKDQAGTFPKHYSVDCDDNFQGSSMRQDGNGTTLNCELIGSRPHHDDGCNPNIVGITYYHVCGGAGECKKKGWAVYAPLTKSCINVRCEPGLSCCDASAGTCNGVSDKQCGDPDTRDCTSPKGGRQTSADEGPSGCPPLGLNNCSYTLPCNSSSPFYPGENPIGPCNDRRRTQSCSFTRTYTCQLQGASTSTNPGDFPGICDVSGYSCSIPEACISYAHTTDPDVRTRCGNPPGTPSIYQNGVCQNPEQYTVQVPCTHCNLWEATSANCPPVTFTGTCGTPSGSCGPKSVGGGNQLQEMCDLRHPTCGYTPPPPPPPPPPTTTTTTTTTVTLPPRVDGECDSNGCRFGQKKTLSEGQWICLGENGGASMICNSTCDTNTDCCDGEGQCSTTPTTQCTQVTCGTCEKKEGSGCSERCVSDMTGPTTCGSCETLVTNDDCTRSCESATTVTCGTCETKEGSGCSTSCVSTMTGPTSCGTCETLVTNDCTNSCESTLSGPTSCGSGQTLVTNGCARSCFVVPPTTQCTVTCGACETKEGSGCSASCVSTMTGPTSCGTCETLKTNGCTRSCESTLSGPTSCPNCETLVTNGCTTSCQSAQTVTCGACEKKDGSGCSASCVSDMSGPTSCPSCETLVTNGCTTSCVSDMSGPTSCPSCETLVTNGCTTSCESTLSGPTSCPSCETLTTSGCTRICESATTVSCGTCERKEGSGCSASCVSDMSGPTSCPSCETLTTNGCTRSCVSDMSGPTSCPSCERPVTNGCTNICVDNMSGPTSCGSCENLVTNGCSRSCESTMTGPTSCGSCETLVTNGCTRSCQSSGQTVTCGTCERKEGSGCNASCVDNMSGPTSCGSCERLVTNNCTRSCVSTRSGPTSCPSCETLTTNGCTTICVSTRSGPSSCGTCETLTTNGCTRSCVSTRSGPTSCPSCETLTTNGCTRSCESTLSGPTSCGSCENLVTNGCSRSCESTRSGPTSCSGRCQRLETNGCASSCVSTESGPTTCSGGRSMEINGCVRRCVSDSPGDAESGDNCGERGSIACNDPADEW